MARISDNYLNSVVYLYNSYSDAENSVKGGGSGFLISVFEEKSPEERMVFIYVVTNKHVILSGSQTIRVNTKDGGIKIIETDERDWVFHDNGDDIAIYLIQYDTKNRILDIDPRDCHVRFVEEKSFINENIIKEMNIGPGDECFVVGRFVNHEGKQKNLPTVRFGCISQMADEPILQNCGYKQQSFLVEAKSIGGYSGSPVYTYIPPGTIRYGVENWLDKILMQHGPWLLGVVWGQINDWMPIMNEQGQPINSNPKSAQVMINTGIMAVVPAWKIRETLNSESASLRRMVFMQNLIKTF